MQMLAGLFSVSVVGIGSAALHGARAASCGSIGIIIAGISVVPSPQPATAQGKVSDSAAVSQRPPARA